VYGLVATVRQMGWMETVRSIFVLEMREVSEHRFVLEMTVIRA
jgi:hypothetical protein